MFGAGLVHFSASPWLPDWETKTSPSFAQWTQLEPSMQMSSLCFTCCFRNISPRRILCGTFFLSRPKNLVEHNIHFFNMHVHHSFWHAMIIFYTFSYMTICIFFQKDFFLEISRKKFWGLHGSLNSLNRIVPCLGTCVPIRNR